MTPHEFIALLRRSAADLPRELEMVPLPGAFDVEVRPPGSKSMTNRALLLAALAEGESVLTGALIDAEDARVMIEALRRLGAEIEIVEESNEPGARATGSSLAGASGSVRMKGTGGRLKGDCTLNLSNSGTATRFLAAAACLADGPVVIDGNARMRQRPMGELIALLRDLGVRVDELGEAGCVPVRVHPLDRARAGDRVRVGATQSSQFISALLLIAPWLPQGLTVEFAGVPTSASYIDMTAGMLRRRVAVSGGVAEGRIVCPAASVRSWRFDIEPDASGATYFWSAAAITPGAACRVPSLGSASVQGDARFVEVLRRMGSAVERDGSTTIRAGALRAIDADLSDMPDAAMTLAAAACFAEGATTITGLRTLRVKETDRLEAIRLELSKLGVKVEIVRTSGARARDSLADSLIPSVDDEAITIAPPTGGIDCSASAPRVAFHTYDDHRMAMSLALIGLRRPKVVIRDPACVAKTYPAFWRHLSLLYESAAEHGSSKTGF